MRLFVSNFPYDTTESDLRGLFAPFGDVGEVKIIIDRDTGQSRGFGFVDMPTTAQAGAAIDKLNGTNYGGRTLRVNEAKAKDDDRGGHGGYAGSRGGSGRGQGRHGW